LHGSHAQLHGYAIPLAIRRARLLAMPGDRELAHSWDDVRIFTAVVRYGGFSAAARALGAQQSTLSRRVAALEHSLGTLLLDRSAAGIVPTALGQRVVAEGERAQAAMHDLYDAVTQQAHDVAGTVRIATTDTVASVFVLPKVLPQLLAAHPKLHIELVTSDDPADLARRQADIAIRFFMPPKGDLLVRRVASFGTAAMAHRKLARRLASQSPTSWPWIFVARPGAPPQEQQWAAALLATPRVTTSSFHAQYEAVRAGLGVAVLPTVLQRFDPTLHILPVPGFAAAPLLELFLVTPRPLRRVPRIAAVFAALTEAFASVALAGKA
jgi:DNA-binding transcriptional LysR family regulator